MSPYRIINYGQGMVRAARERTVPTVPPSIVVDGYRITPELTRPGWVWLQDEATGEGMEVEAEKLGGVLRRFWRRNF